MMNKRILIISFLTIGVVTSCVNLDKLFKSEYDTRTLDIPASIQSVDFQDKRSVVSPGPDIVLPVLSWPGQFTEYHPEFDPTHKRLVLDIIHKNFKSSDAPRAFKINVELIEGVKEFSASFSKETEKVKIKLRITLSNETEKYIAEASAVYFVSSADAKYKRFEELYQRTLQTVAYSALQDLKSSYFSQ